MPTIFGVDEQGNHVSAPYTVSGAAGTLTFDGNALSGIKPWSAAGGGAQAHNYGTADIAPRLRGDVYFGTVLNGVPAIELAHDRPNPDPVTWWLEAVDMNRGLHPLALGIDEYVGISVWVPPSGVTVPNSSGQTNIGEYHMQDVGGQPPWCLMLNRNGGVQILPCLGAYDATTKSFQWSTQNLGAQWVIPPGALVPGWNTIILHFFWAADSSGLMESWYRANGGVWVTGASVSSKPSIAWDKGMTPPTGQFSDNGIMNYGRSFTQPFSVFHAGEFHGTSFAAVAAQLP